MDNSLINLIVFFTFIIWCLCGSFSIKEILVIDAQITAEVNLFSKYLKLGFFKSK